MRGAALLAALALAGCSTAMAAPFPDPPAEAAASHGRAVAVLAGGCFWGMEGLFEHVKGVAQVTAGYAGGSAATANYPAVTTETTGHAEAVRITYDPAVVSYGTLLKVFFAAAHDPTQRDGQTPDEGPSYRSAIFPQSAEQRAEASAYMARINAAHVFAHPLATRLESGQFYPAEAYHQHFMAENPANPYIVMWDVPRVAKLKARFPALYH